MSGLFIFINPLPGGSTVSRSLQISGSVSGAGSGSVRGVWLQFGAGGPVQQVHPGARKIAQLNWSWSGPIPNVIRPGQRFNLIVSSQGSITVPKFPKDPEPDIQNVDGEVVLDLTLEHVVPVLSVTPFQSPQAVPNAQLPLRFRLAGTLTEGQGQAPYGVPKLTYRIGAAAEVTLPVSNGTWGVDLSLPPGEYPITVTASDAFASVDSFSQTLKVLAFPTPPPVDRPGRVTPSGMPSTASITSWTRLEPQCSAADVGSSANARLFDPLWLMTRQWQMGEFQGEDSGSPVQARVRATQAAITRCHFGELSVQKAAGTAYDPATAPLETLVERRRMRPTSPTDDRMLTLAAEAGLHFLRMLDADATARKYRPAFLAASLMQMPAALAEGSDAAARLLRSLAGRAPDARRLVTMFRPTGGNPGSYVPDPALKVAAADLPAVRRVVAAWLAWYDSLFAEPAAPADDAWVPDRLEYAVSVGARLSPAESDGLTLSASEFDGGRLDWSSFDVNQRFSLNTSASPAASTMSRVMIPAPVVPRGAPAARFWEMEDARLAYGLLPAGATDLAHLMLIEYASSYGNDWYVLPLTLPVGSLTRVDSLVVTDTFGVRSLLRPIGDPALPAACFSMWQQSALRPAGEAARPPRPNTFFLPPVIGRSMEGAALEDVLFMRDEMANMAWGIERRLESAVETSLPAARPPTASMTDAAAGSAGLPAYRLASSVPPHWIPLLPVQIELPPVPGTVPVRVSRLKRGAVFQADGSRHVHPARSEALKSADTLLLYDEEVPREGTHVTRQRRMTRWIDGSTWVWTALRNQVGSGEGSSALRFDTLGTGD
jgi:hypothetical protein